MNHALAVYNMIVVAIHLAIATMNVVMPILAGVTATIESLGYLFKLCFHHIDIHQGFHLSGIFAYLFSHS